MTTIRDVATNVYIDLAGATAGSREKTLSLSLSPQPHSLYSRGCDSTNKPAALDSAPLVVLLHSLPSFHLYSTAGAVDGGGGAGWDGSGADWQYFFTSAQAACHRDNKAPGILEQLVRFSWIIGLNAAINVFIRQTYGFRYDQLGILATSFTRAVLLTSSATRSKYSWRDFMPNDMKIASNPRPICGQSGSQHPSWSVV